MSDKKSKTLRKSQWFEINSIADFFVELARKERTERDKEQIENRRKKFFHRK
jgi:hypothetical protein